MRAPKKVFLPSTFNAQKLNPRFFLFFSWMNINQIPKQHVDYLWQLQFESQSAQNATNITQLGSYVQKILFLVSILVQICIFYCQYMMKQLFLSNILCIVLWCSDLIVIKIKSLLVSKKQTHL